MRIIAISCADCNERMAFCSNCGACEHESHTEECRQDWRNLILSY